MGRESMADIRNARDIYEINVRSGAYGERRWVIMPIAAFVLVLLATTGLFLRSQLSGYWYIFSIYAASGILLLIPIVVGRLKRR